MTGLEERNLGTTAIIAIRSLQKDFFAGRLRRHCENTRIGRSSDDTGMNCRGMWENAMLCESCRWTERPGFVRRPAPSASVIADAGALGRKNEAIDLIPCPDCG